MRKRKGKKLCRYLYISSDPLGSCLKYFFPSVPETDPDRLRFHETGISLCPDLHKDHCTGISVSDRHQRVLQSDPVRRQPQILYGRHGDRSRHQHLPGPSVYLWIPLGHRRRSRGNGHRPGRLLCHGRCLSHKIPDHEAHKRLSEDQGG